jgi:hypothetical protein
MPRVVQSDQDGADLMCFDRSGHLDVKHNHPFLQSLVSYVLFFTLSTLPLCAIGVMISRAIGASRSKISGIFIGLSIFDLICIFKEIKRSLLLFCLNAPCYQYGAVYDDSPFIDLFCPVVSRVLLHPNMQKPYVLSMNLIFNTFLPLFLYSPWPYTV